MVIGKIESAHETHTSETICIEPSKFIVVHVEYSQEAISCKNSSMNFPDIVVRYIEPQEPIEIGEEMGLQFAQAVVRQIQVLKLPLAFECILKERKERKICMYL